MRCARLQVATLPIDTAKVRLQLLQRLRQGADAAAGSGTAAGAPVAATPAAAAGAVGSVPPRLGMLSVMRLIAQEEGVTALYKGLWPAIHRQLVFASLRIGLYKQVRSGGQPVSVRAGVLLCST